MICLLGSAIALAAGPPVTIGLVWDSPGQNNVTYRVYATNNPAAPVATWPLLAVVTNPATYGTNQLVFWTPVTPGAMYYTLTASNFWGSSPFSGVASTPPLLPLFTNLGVVNTN